jgi:hypothetical protein
MTSTCQVNCLLHKKIEFDVRLRTIVLVSFSRSFADESRSIFFAISIFLAIAALVAVGFRV